MSCYLRHLNSSITKADIVLVKENRKQVNQWVREWSGQHGVKCNLAWKEMKIKIANEGEDSLIQFLKNINH